MLTMTGGAFHQSYFGKRSQHEEGGLWHFAAE
jgi:hypothetical protein